MAKAKQFKFHECTVIRRMLVTHSLLSLRTGESTETGSEWVTRACGSPLFNADERASGICKSCAKGWKHPHNYRADEEAPTPDSLKD
jgi:hypothetical protein